VSQAHRGKHIVVHDDVEGFQLDLVGRPVDRVAGGIEHHAVETAVMGHGLVDQFGQLLLAADMTSNRDRLAAGLDDLVDHGLATFLAAAGYDHGMTTCGQVFGRSPADAAAGAGDDRNGLGGHGLLLLFSFQADAIRPG
jgi:hypothetical protein